MICDTLQHLGRYRGLHPNLDTAIDYLQKMFSSHPDTMKRIERAKAKAATYAK